MSAAEIGGWRRHGVVCHSIPSPGVDGEPSASQGKFQNECLGIISALSRIAWKANPSFRSRSRPTASDHFDTSKTMSAVNCVREPSRISRAPQSLPLAIVTFEIRTGFSLFGPHPASSHHSRKGSGQSLMSASVRHSGGKSLCPLQLQVPSI